MAIQPYNEWLSTEWLYNPPLNRRPVNGCTTLHWMTVRSSTEWHYNQAFAQPRGWGSIQGPTHPEFGLTHRPTNGLPYPGGGGGGLDTHPPTHPTNYHRPYHRQNALTSAFGADPRSPTMAYPTPGGGGGCKPTHPEILTDPPTHPTPPP